MHLQHLYEPIFNRTMSTKKVIYLMTRSSKNSEFENQPQPEFLWKNSAGKTVGIWGLEWGDLIMKALAESYQNYFCEVWQPDLRADKTYTAQLCKNLIHTNFPAVMKKNIVGIRVKHEIWSDSYKQRMLENDTEDTVFLVPVGAHRLWLGPLVRSLKRAKLLYLTLLNSKLILPDTKYPTNPIRALKLLKINHTKKKSMGRVRNFLVQKDNPTALEKIKQTYPHLRIYHFQMGQDLEFWNRVTTKSEARKALGIPEKPFVIVMSQRLVPEYQIDRFIEVVAGINTEREFICYITGHGTRQYEEYLSRMVANHGLRDKIVFTGFVTDEELRSYFIAADLFATLPKLFAGSGGALKCMALETPILHVTLGSTYELLKEHNAGEYLDPTNYQDWAVKLRELINGRQVRTIPREVIENILGWKRTANDFNEAIKSL